MASYGRVNEFGFIESPYRKVVDGQVTDDIIWLAADDEEEYVVAQANAPLDQQNRFVNDRVLVRRSPQAATMKGLQAQLEQEVFFGATTEISSVPPDEVQLMDVSPKQIVSVATALIPFLEHDDANRALMGANMQRQAVPLVRPEAPYVGTGIEGKAARDAADMIIAKEDGAITDIAGNSITVDYKSAGSTPYKLMKFERSNQDTCINQKPLLQRGRPVPQGRHPGRRPFHRQRRDGLGQEPAGGLHGLGGLQLRGRHHPQRPAGARRRADLHPHPRARDRCP